MTKCIACIVCQVLKPNLKYISLMSPTKVEAMFKLADSDGDMLLCGSEFRIVLQGQRKFA